MKAKIFYPIIMVAVLISSCNLIETGKQNATLVNSQTIDSLILVKQTEPVTLSIALLDDISGSYCLSPVSRDFNILVQLFKTSKGRELLGYTTITENSNSPIVRLSYLDSPITAKSNPNFWIDRQVKDYYTSKYLGQIIDSLNDAELSRFNQEIQKKLDRPIADESDVVLALSRANMFLNESPKANKVMVVCSDFKDTYKRKIDINPEIQLFIIGVADPKDIKKCTGRESGSYFLFESYEEAFFRIVQLFNQ